MRFTVPQFIEHEPKIVGPFTFRQFIYLLIAGGICFVIYFNASFTVFLISTVFIIGITLGLAFGKVNGMPLSAIVAGFFKFSFGPKRYLWKQKKGQMTKLQKAPKQEMTQEETPLKIIKKSQLKKAQTEIETKKE